MTKIYFVLILSLFAFHAKCQIKGVITSETNKPISNASIITPNNLGASSDSLGYFAIKNGAIGDTLKIFHINVKPTTVIIDSVFMEIKVAQQQYTLNEITISNNHAFNLLEKARINTYERLQSKFLRRAYWHGTDIINKDTIFNTYLDLDVNQSQLYKIGKGSLLKTIVVSKNTTEDKITNNENLKIPFQSKLSPFENNFLIYKKFKNEYICTMLENDTTYLLRFYVRKNIKKGYNNIEVSVFKSNHTINYIASCTALQNQTYGVTSKIKGKKIKNVEIALYVKYSYNASYAWLSTFQFNKLFYYTPGNGETVLRKHISSYKTYNHGLAERSGKRISDGFMISNLGKIDNSKTNMIKYDPDIDYDFDYLRNANY